MGSVTATPNERTIANYADPCLTLVPSAMASPQFFRNQQRQSFRNQPRQLFNNQPQPSFRQQQSFNPQPVQTFQPQPQQVFSNQPVVGIRSQDAQQEGANFRNTFESEDGIAVEANGFQGSNGQSNMEGSYRFTLPDGSVAEVRWVADELGFRAESPLLPVAPAMPAHALEQIRFAEQQRAQGVQWNDQGFRIN